MRRRKQALADSIERVFPFSSSWKTLHDPFWAGVRGAGTLAGGFLLRHLPYGDSVHIWSLTL